MESSTKSFQNFYRKLKFERVISIIKGDSKDQSRGYSLLFSHSLSFSFFKEISSLFESKEKYFSAIQRRDVCRSFSGFHSFHGSGSATFANNFRHRIGEYSFPFRLCFKSPVNRHFYERCVIL